jgi:hypothetical protein
MKKLIVAALLVIGFSTYAQEETETKKKSNKNSQAQFRVLEFFLCYFYF